MKKRILCVFVLALTLLSFFSQSALASELPEKPPGSSVLDTTGLISQSVIDEIDQLNNNWFETEQGLQVGIYVTDTSDTDIDELANSLARKWQIGRADTKMGALIVIYLEQRQFRIETSDHLATTVTDVVSQSILDGAKSYMRAEDYDGGLTYMVTALGDEVYETETVSVSPSRDDLVPSSLAGSASATNSQAETTTPYTTIDGVAMTQAEYDAYLQVKRSEWLASYWNSPEFSSRWAENTEKVEYTSRFEDRTSQSSSGGAGGGLLAMIIFGFFALVGVVSKSSGKSGAGGAWSTSDDNWSSSDSSGAWFSSSNDWSGGSDDWSSSDSWDGGGFDGGGASDDW